MTALNIVSQARERLGDIKKHRWSDNRLLSIVSMGQQDICKWTNFLRKVTYIPITNDISIYKLPDDFYRASRLEYNGSILPLYTRDDMDIPKTISTDYIAFKSNMEFNKIEIYPKPTDLTEGVVWSSGLPVNSFYISNQFGVVTSINDSNYILVGDNEGEITDGNRSLDTGESSKFGELFDYGSKLSLEFGENLGVITSIDTEISSGINGFITSVKGHTVSNLYGLVADVKLSSEIIKVYYVALPKKLTYLEAFLVIPELWEDLLIRYTVGTALQDDNDANNIQRGEMELQKYQQQVLKLRAESTKDFSGGAKDKLVTNYRGI
jgi:hypothetical protein